MSEIRSKVPCRGHENESSWPSEFGTREPGRYLHDAESGEMKPAHEVRAKEQVYIIPDTLKEGPLESMTGSGLITDSKSALRRDYKNHDMREAQTTYDRKSAFDTPEHKARERAKDIRDDTERAFYDIKYDKVPFSEKEKETFRREERKWKSYQEREDVKRGKRRFF